MDLSQTGDSYWKPTIFRVALISVKEVNDLLILQGPNENLHVSYHPNAANKKKVSESQQTPSPNCGSDTFHQA